MGFLRMKYLPFENFEIHTDLTSDEVFYKLRAAVDTKRKWWIFTNKPFWGGEVERHYFRFWRVTWWSRNFTPIVSGKINSEDSGCCVRVRMRMPWFGFLFYSFWLGAIWFMYFGAIVNLIIQKIKTGIWQIESPWQLLPLIGMFAFGYLISVGTFMSEAIDVKEYLLWLSGTKKENIIYIDRVFGITESQIIMSLFLVTVFVSLGWIVFNLLR
jgi:hypothetical protein